MTTLSSFAFDRLEEVDNTGPVPFVLAQYTDCYRLKKLMTLKTSDQRQLISLLCYQ